MQKVEEERTGTRNVKLSMCSLFSLERHDLNFVANATRFNKLDKLVKYGEGDSINLSTTQ